MSSFASFTSLAFIFRFLPLFLIIYYIAPAKARNIVAYIGSLIFYAFGEPVYVILLLLLTLVNYLIAAKSLKIPEVYNQSFKKSDSRKYMITAVIIDIAVLALFKALATFGSGIFGTQGFSDKLFLGSFLNEHLHIGSYIMPLGLSFYIFKMLSYQIDVYRGNMYATPTFTDTALYFSFFPQISEGPIMRYDDGDFHEDKTVSLKTLEEGFKLFVIGLSLKLLLADRIGILWNDLAMYGYDSISTPLAWLGAFAYSLELYFDFYGYSLMAGGIAVMLGYDFIRNFDSPYASTSISEFYRRWHITLGSFFRDYVYFPMGGSRCSKKRTALNLLIVWLLTGIWHGNGLNFIIWGLLLGGFIVLEKLLYGKGLSHIKPIGHIYVIILIPITWVIFAISDIRSLGLYLSRMFPFWGSSAHVNNTDVIEYLKDYGALFIAAIILCLPVCERLYTRYKKSPIVVLLFAALFWVCIYFSASSVNNPFMYLKF